MFNVVFIGNKTRVIPSGHTFATRFLEQGGGIKALQEILGHMDGSLTITYSHVLGSTVHHEMGKMAGVLSRPPSPEEFNTYVPTLTPGMWAASIRTDT